MKKNKNKNKNNEGFSERSPADQKRQEERNKKKKIEKARKKIEKEKRKIAREKNKKKLEKKLGKKLDQVELSPIVPVVVVKTETETVRFIELAVIKKNDTEEARNVSSRNVSFRRDYNNANRFGPLNAGKSVSINDDDNFTGKSDDDDIGVNFGINGIIADIDDDHNVSITPSDRFLEEKMQRGKIPINKRSFKQQPAKRSPFKLKGIGKKISEIGRNLQKNICPQDKCGDLYIALLTVLPFLSPDRMMRVVPESITRTFLLREIFCCIPKLAAKLLGEKTDETYGEAIRYDISDAFKSYASTNMLGMAAGGLLYYGFVGSTPIAGAGEVQGRLALSGLIITIISAAAVLGGSFAVLTQQLINSCGKIPCGKGPLSRFFNKSHSLALKGFVNEVDTDSLHAGEVGDGIIEINRNDGPMLNVASLKGKVHDIASCSPALLLIGTCTDWLKLYVVIGTVSAVITAGIVAAVAIMSPKLVQALIDASETRTASEAVTAISAGSAVAVTAHYISRAIYALCMKGKESAQRSLSKRTGLSCFNSRSYVSTCLFGPDISHANRSEMVTWARNMNRVPKNRNGYGVDHDHTGYSVVASDDENGTDDLLLNDEEENELLISGENNQYVNANNSGLGYGDDIDDIDDDDEENQQQYQKI